MPLCIRKTWLPFILVKKTICDSIRCFLTSGVFYFLYSLINTHHYFACLKNVFSINLLNCKTISFSLESLLPVFLDEMLPTTNCMCVHTHTHTSILTFHGHYYGHAASFRCWKYKNAAFASK